MKHYQYFSLNNSYYPTSLFFWGIPSVGSTVDVVLETPKRVKSVRFITGLDEADGRINGSGFHNGRGNFNIAQIPKNGRNESRLREFHKYL